jgi:hypothetical protein
MPGIITDGIIGGAIMENDRNKACQTNLYPKPGDILAVNCGLYYHYGVYSGKNHVIHYSAKNGNFGKSINVHETALNHFLRGGRCLICRFPDICQKPDLGTKIFKMIRNPTVFSVLDSVSALLTELSGSGFHLYSGKETVERARSRLGEDKYNLIFNNCEHFAVWCKTGISGSSQVSTVLSFLAKVPTKIL